MKLSLSIDHLVLLLGDLFISTTVSGDTVIQNLTSLEAATASDLVVMYDRGDASVFSPASLDCLKQSKALIVLAAAPLVEGKEYLLVTDPLKALTRIADAAAKMRDEKTADAEVSPDACVHESAVIERGAIINPGAVISALAYVGKRVKIGAGVRLHPTARVLDDCVVGDGSIIHAGAVIGSDGYGYCVTKSGLIKVPQVGNVVIGRQVEIGANTTIDRASFDSTIIHDLVKIDNLVHIAHNVVVGAGTAIIAQTGIAGSVVIGRGCQIGGQVAIKDHITIGDGAKIVSKSAVMKNVAPGEVVCGIPAIPFNEWKRGVVVLAKLPELYKKFTDFEKRSRLGVVSKIKGMLWHS